MVTTQSSHSLPSYNARRYFTLTFAFTFALWGVGALLSFSQELADFYMLFMLAGLITPFMVAVMLLERSTGNGSRWDLIRRMVHPEPISPGMLPVLLLLMPLSVVIATAISLLMGEPVTQFHMAEHFSFTTGVVPVLLMLFIAALFEELGWRGYGFESLRRERSLLFTSLIFGLLWSLWHLPLLLVNGSYQYEILQQSPWYAINFFIAIVPMGVIISWIYVRSGNSILVAVVFHFITNLSQEALQISQTTKLIQTLVLSLFVLIIVVYDRKRLLAQEEVR
ncbi:MAG: type II CAAX endopeptidase family protein [Candidatus Thiodiazotropha sp.]